MKSNMAKDLERAKLIKKMREERAWPQSQLADVADINLRTVQRVEKDGTASLETLMAIANAFEIDVKQLSPASLSKNSRELEPKKVYLLPRLVSGKNLVNIIGGADLYQVEHDAADDIGADNAMAAILNEVKKDIVRYYDADPARKLEIELELSQEIKGLEAYGFYFFGVKREIPRIIGKRTTQVMMCTIYMSHSDSPKIVKDKYSNMMIPAVLSEVVDKSTIQDV